MESTKHKLSMFFHPLFLENTGRRIEEFYTVRHGATLLELIRQICGEDELLIFKLMDEQGNLRPHVNIFLDSDNCRNLEGLETKIQSNAEISIFPALSGG